MLVTRIIRRTVITRLALTKLERFKPIDLRIPSHAVRITGVLVTTSSPWHRGGSVTVQASDSADIFYRACIGSDDARVLSDEAMMGFTDTAFHKPWVTGRVPELEPVDLAGDNVYIRAWFKGTVFQVPFTISVYVQYEGAEELIGIEPEQPPADTNPIAYIR